jgi:hypothetical protein
LKLAELAKPGVLPKKIIPDANSPGVERLAALPPMLVDYRPQFEPGEPNPPSLWSQQAIFWPVNPRRNWRAKQS